MTNFGLNFKVLVGALIFIMSCSNDDASSLVPEPESDVPFQELYDQGIDRYLGTISPVESVAQGNGVTEHIFSSENGPVCFTGKQFSMFTRNAASNNLLIFLQGGGLCTPFGCSDPVVDEGIPLIPFGILGPADVTNPTYNYNLGYLPYCDASTWMGDSEVDSDGDGQIDRLHKGLLNLSASLDVVYDRFPMPDKIVLAGNSAGGMGVHAALPLVRKLYPEVTIMVINDSGIAVSNPGVWEATFDYWNSLTFIPESCTDCLGDGTLTNYYNYQLSQDENMEMAFISAKQDAVSSGAIGGEAFETQLIDIVSELNGSFPDRFNSLIPNGDEHTFIVSDFDYQVGDFTVKDWVSAMINGSEDWVSFTE